MCSDIIEDESTPLVSVICITYNHEDFISQAIESMLFQKTTFPFEIIIHDDASSDKTPDIIKKYAGLYPEIIKPIFQKINQYSLGVRPRDVATELARGKYIASVDGDDYWTDPYKLEKQAAFLESNPEYFMSGHDAFIIDRAGNKIKDSKLPDRFKRDFSRDELIKKQVWVLTLSWMYRNEIKKFPPERSKVKNGDAFLTSLFGHYGKCKYHNDISPAAYRSHGGGVWSGTSSQEKRDDKINTWFWLYRYYKRIGLQQYEEYFWEKYILLSLMNGSSSSAVVKIFLKFFKSSLSKFFFRR